jgi:2'-5' RNA ligase
MDTSAAATPGRQTGRPAPPREERWRLFVAVELPAPWRTWLADRAARLESLAPHCTRWVRPELFHLTVLFLGDQAVSRVTAIEAALGQAAGATPPFELALGQLGHFGGDRPRVLWAEAKAPPGTLDRLHARLAHALHERKVAFDTKPLVAHLTLGRARRDADPTTGRALARELPAMKLPAPPPPFTVHELTLMRSELQAGGPRYTALGHWALGTNERADAGSSRP